MPKPRRSAGLLLILIALAFPLSCRNSDTTSANPTPGAIKPQAPAAPAGIPAAPPNSPQDQLVPITQEMRAKIDDMSKDARKSLPSVQKRFHAGLPKGQTLFVTTEAHTEQGHAETLFVLVTKWDNGRIGGEVATKPVEVTTLKQGGPISIAEADVVDWMISRPDGTEEGNTVGKYLDSRAK